MAPLPQGFNLEQWVRQIKKTIEPLKTHLPLCTQCPPLEAKWSSREAGLNNKRPHTRRGTQPALMICLNPDSKGKRKKGKEKREEKTELPGGGIFGHINRSKIQVFPSPPSYMLASLGFSLYISGLFVYFMDFSKVIGKCHKVLNLNRFICY